MSTNQADQIKQLAEKYVADQLRLRRLKNECAHLEEEGSFLEREILTGLFAAGQTSIRVGDYLVSMKGVKHLDILEYNQTLTAIKSIGLGNHVREQIVNSRTLTQTLAEMGEIPELEGKAEIEDQYVLTIERVST